MKAPRLGELRWSIQVVRRTLQGPEPLNAEPNHGYTPVLTTRAKAETKGTSEFNRVVISGKEATHVFTIRFSTIQIDVRDRILDSLGNLYTILKIDVMDEGRRWMRIYTARVGSQDRAVVS